MASKQFHALQKRVLDIAIKLVGQDPAIGKAKEGDLHGIYVYKFRLTQQQCLVT